MSIATCQECTRFIDTDDDPGAYIVTIDGEDRCVCEICRESLKLGEFSEEHK